jgi:hypothetical protein
MEMGGKLSEPTKLPVWIKVGFSPELVPEDRGNPLLPSKGQLNHSREGKGVVRRMLLLLLYFRV